jgi:hypothetical protein
LVLASPLLPCWVTCSVDGIPASFHATIPTAGGGNTELTKLLARLSALVAVEPDGLEIKDKEEEVQPTQLATIDSTSQMQPSSTSATPSGVFLLPDSPFSPSSGFFSNHGHWPISHRIQAMNTLKRCTSTPSVPQGCGICSSLDHQRVQRWRDT